jgi:2-polyprenyl-6-methoxyphenol hydroxylase-like FAD-dependent oxidoreductase
VRRIPTAMLLGCPSVGTYAFDFGPFTIAGSPGTDDAPVAYAPRGTVLDKLLIDAAASAGAEVREGFTVHEVLTDDGRVTGICGRGKDGHVVCEHARMVIGADGLHSAVAVAGWPHVEFAANKTDIEGSYLKTFDLAPDFAGRIRAAN